MSGVHKNNEKNIIYSLFSGERIKGHKEDKKQANEQKKTVRINTLLKISETSSVISKELDFTHKLWTIQC